jgi:hypothetical protein
MSHLEELEEGGGLYKGGVKGFKIYLWICIYKTLKYIYIYNTVQVHVQFIQIYLQLIKIHIQIFYLEEEEDGGLYKGGIKGFKVIHAYTYTVYTYVYI